MKVLLSFSSEFWVFIFLFLYVLTLRWWLPISYASRFFMLELIPKKAHIWWHLVPIKLEAQLYVYVVCIGTAWVFLYWLSSFMIPADMTMSDLYDVLMILFSGLLGVPLARRCWKSVWPCVLDVVEDHGFTEYLE